MRRPLLLAAALLVLVNGYVLAGVVWNRSGPPEATLTLTERELPTAWSSPLGENSGVSLRIDVVHWRPEFRPYPRGTDVDWLSREKLTALGFDTVLPRDLSEAHRQARRQLSHRAYAVLQYGGSAWEARQQVVAADLARVERRVAAGAQSADHLATERSRAAQQGRIESRLFVVDAGLDPAALRAAHPDKAQFLLVPAKISVFVDLDDKATECVPEHCRLRGSVSLLIDEVAVPRRLQGALPAPSVARGVALGQDSPEWTPRYEVLLHSGARYEPWIEAIRPISP